MKNDEAKNEGKDAVTDSLETFELSIKRTEAKTARLKLKREKLFHKKILEIAGYDDKGSI